MNKHTFTLPRTKNVLRLLALPALAGAPLLADAAAGHFLFVSGPAQIIAANGHARAAHRGDAFDQGETIATAAHTIAQIRMEDGNMVSVQPNTRLHIDQFSYHGHPQASDRNYISLAKGAFRSITGAISKDHYRITTPDATIGIRGTDHVAMYVPPGSSTAIPAGTYDKVNTGRTFLATTHGEIEIAPNQAGYVPSATATPHLLPTIPDFLKSSSTPPRNTAATSNKQDTTAAGNKQDAAPASNKQETAANNNSNGAAPSASASNASPDSSNANPATTTTASAANTDSSMPAAPAASSVSADTPVASSVGTNTLLSPATSTITPLPVPVPPAASNGPAGFAVAAISTNTDGTMIPVGGVSAAQTAGDSYTIDPSGNLKTLTLHHNQNTSSVLVFDSATSATRILPQTVYTDPTTGDVVHWGRWTVPNSVARYSLSIDGVPVNATSDFHYMYSNNTTSPQQLAHLPQLNILTGNYTMVPGASTLTDGLGHAGTVNTATMGVNFSTQQITSYNLDMTVNSNRWQASLLSPTSIAGSQYMLNLSATETPMTVTTAAPAPITASGVAQGNFVGSTATSAINMFGLHSTTGDNAIGTVLMHR